MTDRPAEPTIEDVLDSLRTYRQSCEGERSDFSFISRSLLDETIATIAALTAAKEAAEAKYIGERLAFVAAEKRLTAAEKRAEALEDELGGYRIQCSDLKALFQAAEKQCEELRAGLNEAAHDLQALVESEDSNIDSDSRKEIWRIEGNCRALAATSPKEGT